MFLTICAPDFLLFVFPFARLFLLPPPVCVYVCLCPPRSVNSQSESDKGDYSLGDVVQAGRRCVCVSVFVPAFVAIVMMMVVMMITVMMVIIEMAMVCRDCDGTTRFGRPFVRRFSPARLAVVSGVVISRCRLCHCHRLYLHRCHYRQHHDCRNVIPRDKLPLKTVSIRVSVCLGFSAAISLSSPSIAFHLFVILYCKAGQYQRPKHR